MISIKKLLTKILEDLNQTIFHKGKTYTAIAGRAIGNLTSSSKEIQFFVPSPVSQNATSITITDLALVVRHVHSGYAYARSGTNGETYTAYGSALTNVMVNSQFIRENEVDHITVTLNHRMGFTVGVTLNYAPARSNGGTAIDNNTPFAVVYRISFTVN